MIIDEPPKSIILLNVYIMSIQVVESRDKKRKIELPHCFHSSDF